MAQTSKNNPAARAAANPSKQLLRAPEQCYLCGGELKYLGEREPVQVGRRMLRRHKGGDCPKAS